MRLFKIKNKEITFMRINKNYWLTASGALAVAGAIMLLSAHRIEAQYSSPVRVMNTTSGPAIASLIDEPGRTPYQARIVQQPASNTTSISFTFGAVPANHRLVVQHVSGNLTVTAGSPAASIGLAVLGFVPTSLFFTPTLGGLNNFDQPVLVYFDGGQQPSVTAFGPTFVGSSSEIMTLTGYLIDCSAAPCAAIAQ
jgi:hypothetical protein